MPELKKIDFRNLGGPSASQPSAPEKAKKGHPLKLLSEAFSRMSRKVKIELGILVIALLLAIGFVALHFFG